MHGTFAEYAVVPVDRFHRNPVHLDFPQTTALPMGGLTAFRALFHEGEF